jgi:hypothetical protein
MGMDCSCADPGIVGVATGLSLKHGIGKVGIWAEFGVEAATVLLLASGALVN